MNLINAEKELPAIKNAFYLCSYKGILQVMLFRQFSFETLATPTQFPANKEVYWSRKKVKFIK